MRLATIEEMITNWRERRIPGLDGNLANGEMFGKMIKMQMAKVTSTSTVLCGGKMICIEGELSLKLLVCPEPMIKNRTNQMQAALRRGAGCAWDAFMTPHSIGRSDRVVHELQRYSRPSVFVFKEYSNLVVPWSVLDTQEVTNANSLVMRGSILGCTLYF